MKNYLSFSVAIAAASLLFHPQADAALTATGFTLASADGGNGTNINNIEFFDGVVNTPFTSRAEPFGTLLYLRERSDTTVNTQRRVQANVNFDVSSLTVPVASATLDFTGYASNGFPGVTVTVGRLDAAMSFGAASSLDHTFDQTIYGASFPTGSTGTSGEFSVDVTDIVNSWIGGATNNGFILKITQPAVAVNDGFGIADDATDGTVMTLNVTQVPEPSSAALLGLGGLALILRRRK